MTKTSKTKAMTRKQLTSDLIEFCLDWAAAGRFTGSGKDRRLIFTSSWMQGNKSIPITEKMGQIVEHLLKDAGVPDKYKAKVWVDFPKERRVKPSKEKK